MGTRAALTHIELGAIATEVARAYPALAVGLWTYRAVQETATRCPTGQRVPAATAPLWRTQRLLWWRRRVRVARVLVRAGSPIHGMPLWTWAIEPEHQ